MARKGDKAVKEVISKYERVEKSDPNIRNIMPESLKVSL